MTRKHSLDATAREQLEAARRSGAQRAASTIVGGHERVMRQTVVALMAGAEMAEHENPGEATLIVLNGRVQVDGDGTTWEARTGDLIEIPPARHTLRALEDSAVLLSAVPKART
jgi:quercetin dioxygenase-like cupin family protein